MTAHRLRLALTAIVFILIGQYSVAQGLIHVIDKTDSTDIVAATVFTRSGSILGMTDQHGQINAPVQGAYPLLIKCMGYEQAVCDENAHIVTMDPCAYPLKELVVNAVERPVNHIICYVREYVSGSTNDHSEIYFNEHMADFFVTNDKVKGFKASNTPRFLTSRLHTRIIEDGVDSIFVPGCREGSITWENLINIPNGIVKVEGDSIAGKYSLKHLKKHNGDVMILCTDYLADNKDHTMSPWLFKMLGFTIDITEFMSKVAVRSASDDYYYATDILSATFSFDILGRGKWIKKAFRTDNPVRMNGYYEIYPVEIEHLTVEDANELRKYPPTVPMQVSPLAPAPEPAIQYILDNCRE